MMALEAVSGSSRASAKVTAQVVLDAVDLGLMLTRSFESSLPTSVLSKREGPSASGFGLGIPRVAGDHSMVGDAVPGLSLEVGP